MALDKLAQNGHLLAHIIRRAHPGADPEELDPHILQRRRERRSPRARRLEGFAHFVEQRVAPDLEGILVRPALHSRRHLPAQRRTIQMLREWGAPRVTQRARLLLNT